MQGQIAEFLMDIPLWLRLRLFCGCACRASYTFIIQIFEFSNDLIYFEYEMWGSWASECLLYNMDNKSRVNLDSWPSARGICFANFLYLSFVSRTLNRLYSISIGGCYMVVLAGYQSLWRVINVNYLWFGGFTVWHFRFDFLATGALLQAMAGHEPLSHGSFEHYFRPTIYS